MLQKVALSVLVASGIQLSAPHCFGQNQKRESRSIHPQSGGTEVKVVLSNLDSPWAVLPSPEGDLWITEKSGKISIYDAGFELKHTLSGFPDMVAAGQGGLLDIAFHPRHAENHWVYLAYTVGSPSTRHTRVTRFTWQNQTLTEPKIIVDGPEGSDNAHFGCRLVFDRQGYLYASFGERHQKEKAQRLDSLHGKVVRLHDDGKIPTDNPFGPTNAIFTYGHRNPQGLDIHPESGVLYVSEHGPSGYDAPPGGDEINVLSAGANYGWPVIHHQMQQTGMRSPLLEYTPALAPSGAHFYTGDKIPAWKNNLFVAMLAGQSLLRVEIKNDGTIGQTEELFKGVYGRLRDVGQHSDGSLLVITDGGELLQISKN